MKACKLGSEVSWLPLLCIQKGVLYEGYMHKPQLMPAIEKDLLNSRVYLIVQPSCHKHNVIVVCLHLLFRAGVTTRGWAAGAFRSATKPTASNSTNCCKTLSFVKYFFV